jgi:hypothetical protein
VFLLVSTCAAATSSTCPDLSKLAGSYETKPPVGYPSNEFEITIAKAPDDYGVSLLSTYSSKPFDDGSHVSVGEFEGKLIVPRPWSCVAMLELVRRGVEEDFVPITCSLVFRFVGGSVVYVESMGNCDYFHGHRAYPDGKYIKRK